MNNKLRNIFLVLLCLILIAVPVLGIVQISTDQRIEKIVRNENGELIVVYNNGKIENLGMLPAGPQGEKGDTGLTGAAGKDGINGKDGADGKDGINGKDGADGKDGINGKDGADGKDGLTPYIGEDGFWYIGSECTNILATTIITEWQMEINTNWSNVKIGDIVSFDFKPNYTSYREYEDQPSVYAYQSYNNARYCITIYETTLDGKSMPIPKKGQDDYSIYTSESYNWSCIGKIISISGVHIDIDIIYAKSKVRGTF